MMVEVTQEDREAAASGYYAWCSGNPVIPNRILGGNADDHSMVQAFARHRIAADQRGKLEGAPLALEAAKTKIRQFDPEHYSVENDDGDMICSIIADDLAALDPAKIVGEG